MSCLLPSIARATLIEMQANGATSGSFVGILAVGWQQTTASQNVTVTVPFYCEPPGTPQTAVAYLMTSIGPGTTPANQLATAQITVSPSAGPSVNYVMFSGLNLAAGSYYIVIDTGNHCIGWSGNSDFVGEGILSAASGFRYLGSYALDAFGQSGYEPGYPVNAIFGYASLNFAVSGSAGSTTGPGTATHFSVSAADAATTGLPVEFTVTALDANNNPVTDYSDPVQFTSTDPAAELPAIANLTNGVGTFSAALGTPGMVTITAGDFFSPTITGTSSSITVSQSSAGLRFVSMQPCRVVDTRDNTRPAGFGGPAMAAATTRSFAIQNGPCAGIPANVEAYALNVTVVPHGELGYLTVWPTGQPQPLASTLNSYDGEVKANAAIVAAGAGSAVSLFATNVTDVVLDINGYFVPETEPETLAFYPMTPCRLVDTRMGAPATIITGRLAAMSTTTLPILSSSCNVPATAQAYSLNFTLVPPDAPVAYVTVWPAGQNQPLVSTLNDPAGTVEANAAIEPAGAAGSINIFVTNTTDLVVDINGYFAPPAQGGLSLYALPPCRVLDTRDLAGSMPFTGAVNVNVSGATCGGTRTAQAYVLNATVVPQGFLGYLTLWPEGSTQPLVSTLNAYNGEVTSNMAVVPASNTEISGFALDSTNLILDLFGYFAP